MRTRDAVRILFPRKRRWQPTQRWRGAMRENLSRAPRRRSSEETWRIKEAVRDWLAMPAKQRPTQEELARSLRVTKQYINRLVRKLPPRDDFSEPATPSVIPAHIAAREALLRSPVSYIPPQPPETAQAQPGLSRASYSAVHSSQIDAAILGYIGFNPNRSKGWF